MKQGALVVNYFGHGGEDGLARERIFDKIDAEEITNDKFNCFVSVTCEFTKFDNPTEKQLVNICIGIKMEVQLHL